MSLINLSGHAVETRTVSQPGHRLTPEKGSPQKASSVIHDETIRSLWEWKTDPEWHDIIKGVYDAAVSPEALSEMLEKYRVEYMSFFVHKSPEYRAAREAWDGMIRQVSGMALPGYCRVPEEAKERKERAAAKRRSNSKRHAYGYRL